MNLGLREVQRLGWKSHTTELISTLCREHSTHRALSWQEGFPYSLTSGNHGSSLNTYPLTFVLKWAREEQLVLKLWFSWVDGPRCSGGWRPLIQLETRSSDRDNLWPTASWDSGISGPPGGEGWSVEVTAVSDLVCPFILAGEGEVTRLPHVSGQMEGVQALGASAAATPSGPKSHQAGTVPLRVAGYFQHRGEGARYLYCWDTQPERRPLWLCVRLTSELGSGPLRWVSRLRRGWMGSRRNFIRWALRDSENLLNKTPEPMGSFVFIKQGLLSLLQKQTATLGYGSIVWRFSARILWLFEKRVILGSAQGGVADCGCKRRF